MVDFDNFCTIGNRNEYSIKQVQTASLQPDCVFTLPGETKNNTKTTDRFLQCILSNRLFLSFAKMSFSVPFPSFCSPLAIFRQNIFILSYVLIQNSISKVNIAYNLNMYSYTLCCRTLTITLSNLDRF